MAKGKKYTEARSKVDRTVVYGIDEAIQLVKDTATAKFDETFDLTVRLGVDPRKADQMIRGAVVLPSGLGKDVRILVFAKGEKALEAKEAGADYIGDDDLVEKIKAGWFEFDSCIATPDMMGTVGKIGKLLGPRGLMPNPKVGTVTFDLASTIKETKAGKVEYRVEKAGIIHAGIGKVSFDADKLKANILSIMDALIKAKPSTAKGTYLRKVSFSSTMGPGVTVDAPSLQTLLK